MLRTHHEEELPELVEGHGNGRHHLQPRRRLVLAEDYVPRREVRHRQGRREVEQVPRRLEEHRSFPHQQRDHKSSTVLQEERQDEHPDAAPGRVQRVT